MIDRLFAVATPSKNTTVLDPGCGDGAFIDGLIRWCQSHGLAIPNITGVENHPGRAETAREKFKRYPSISIENRDFLIGGHTQYDYVIGNPPYVSILQILEHERELYRARYQSARGRFDLYILFFEEALRHIKPGGRLVFITPEKYLYVNTCTALRTVLTQHRMIEITLVNENAFKGLVTYPTVTTIDKVKPAGTTVFTDRDGISMNILLPKNGSSFLPAMGNHKSDTGGTKLEDICIRISCGIATGADEVYVVPLSDLPKSLERFSHPTISGRQLINNRPIRIDEVMLIPYDKHGKLIQESRLGTLAKKLSAHRENLLKRVCAKRKPWYAFHDNVPFGDMLLPKILCKDITKTPHFWADHDGSLVPRHSVYYIVPKDPDVLDALIEYLNGANAQAWLQANCQRAANGFLRVQSSVLRKLPIPETILKE